MQQLTEMDYVFVQMESSRSPMHISPVIFYDQSEVADGPQSVILQQVSNGIAVRMAILSMTMSGQTLARQQESALHV